MRRCRHAARHRRRARCSKDVGADNRNERLVSRSARYEPLSRPILTTRFLPVMLLGVALASGSGTSYRLSRGCHRRGEGRPPHQHLVLRFLLPGQGQAKIFSSPNDGFTWGQHTFDGVTGEPTALAAYPDDPDRFALDTPAKAGTSRRPARACSGSARDAASTETDDPAVHGGSRCMTRNRSTGVSSRGHLANRDLPARLEQLDEVRRCYERVALGVDRLRGSPICLILPRLANKS